MEDRNYHLTLHDEGLDVQCLKCDGTAVYTLYEWFHGILIEEALEQCHFEDCPLKGGA